jgi:hypothetical protein
MIAETGSISTGTLRTPDLLRAFDGALGLLVSGSESDSGLSDWEAGRLCGEALAYADVLDDLSDVSDVSADADAKIADAFANVEICAAGVVDALIEALDDFAPDGCYFGAHEGDGADFGFWPVAETVAS